MRIKHLPWIFAFAAVITLSASVLYPDGAPPAKTGSPGDGGLCTECHGGSGSTTAGLITSNIPTGGYVPGTTYTITATNPLSGTAKMGFEVSPQNISGTQLGTLIAGPGNQLVGSDKYVTHLLANNTTNTWTFSWVAPAAGTGAVTFYGAFVRGHPGPVTKSTLTVQEAVSLPEAAGAISGPSSVCKNNSESYSVGTIAGATNYVWVAPSGASIVSGQGTTSVNVSFGPSATSGAISVNGSNTAGSGTPSLLAIAVNTIPDVPATPQGPANVNLENTATSSYSTTGVASLFSWQILPANAGTISGTGTAAQVTWNNAFHGVAQLQVKAMNGCGESEWSTAFAVQVINTTGLNNKTEDIVVRTSESGYITLDMNTDADQANIMLIDLSGRMLLNTTVAGTGTQQLNQQLKSGIYIVAVQAGNFQFRKKILIAG